MSQDSFKGHIEKQAEENSATSPHSVNTCGLKSACVCPDKTEQQNKKALTSQGEGCSTFIDILM